VKKFNVTLIKSKIGCSADQIRTITALGLKRRLQTVVVADNAANRGQMVKIQHLLKVEIA